MNGLSQVLDPFVTNSYPNIFSINTQTTTLSSSQTIVSSERQLAFEAYPNKALVDRDRVEPIVCTSAADFDNGVFNGITDSESCLNNYFCDQHLTQEWNQFNDSFISNNNLNTEPLIDSNDLNQCFNNFETNFETNIDINSNPNENSIKQNSKKVNNKLTNNKKLSRKESNPIVRPPKPVSAYALFFRDAQSQIKSANPSASFGEISKVVASNWEALDKKDKNIYKERADHEKKNYLKTLASSRAQQIAGLMAASSAKLGLSSGQTEMIATNDNNQQNQKTNNFNTTSQQMPEQSSIRHNSSADQNISDNSSQNIVSTSDQSSGVPKPHCIRSGCVNDAIDSSEWDSEYCSSECCVKHCADVFQAWVQKQQFPQN